MVVASFRVLLPVLRTAKHQIGNKILCAKQRKAESAEFPHTEKYSIRHSFVVSFSMCVKRREELCVS